MRHLGRTTRVERIRGPTGGRGWYRGAMGFAPGRTLARQVGQVYWDSSQWEMQCLPNVWPLLMSSRSADISSFGKALGSRM